MADWNEAIRQAKEKDEEKAIQDQLVEWQRERDQGSSGRGKYNENENEDITTREGRKEYLERVKKETEEAVRASKRHTSSVQNDISNYWTAISAGYKVSTIDGVNYYSKDGKTWDEDGRDRTDEM